VDAVPERELRSLRSALPSVALVQVIHVMDEASVAEALQVAPLVDALLLDSGTQQLAVQELGGTGRTHDWTLSRRIRDQSTVPVFLAGGLHDGNVGDALATVAPFGLDLCSGVRTDGQLDHGKLIRFLAAVRQRIAAVQ